MKLSKKKSLVEFYEKNSMYSKPLNEGFFGELFAGVLKAFASLFGVEIKEVSNSTVSSSQSSFSSRVSDAASKGDIKVPKDKKLEDLDSKDLDPEKVKEIVSDVVAEKIEGAAEEISALEGVPAFGEATEKEEAEVKEASLKASGIHGLQVGSPTAKGGYVTSERRDSNTEIISEQDAQVEENKPQMVKASKGVGTLLGLCRFIKDKVKDFDFTEPPDATTPGDLVQIAVYLANRIEKGGFGDATEEPERVISFAEKYSQENDFSIKKDDAKYAPSSDVKGEQGEAIAATKEELDKEDPEDSKQELEKEIEEIEPEIDAANEENPEKLEAELEDSAEKLGVSTKEFADGIADIEKLQDLIKDKNLKVADVIAAINDAEEGLKTDDEEGKEPSEDKEDKEGDAEEEPKELEPAEIEELDPTDDVQAAEKEAELPKDGVTLSLTNWFDSLSKTSQGSLKSGDKIGKLRTGIFQAIDKSVDEVTNGVETAIGMWRQENEEALIKSKRFAKKNFDALQKLVPQMVAFILKKSNESAVGLTFGSIKKTVFKLLNEHFCTSKYSLKILLEEEEKSEEPAGNPEKDADPTDEIAAAGKSNLSPKDAVLKAMQDWGSSLSKTSQQTLKSSQRGETLNDLIATAVDDAAAIVKQEVEKAVSDWRSAHEEDLIKSKRFAKKNFDSLQKTIPDLVANIMTKANESSALITRRNVRTAVFKALDNKFLKSDHLFENRWTKLAGL